MKIFYTLFFLILVVSLYSEEIFPTNKRMCIINFDTNGTKAVVSFACDGDEQKIIMKFDSAKKFQNIITQYLPSFLDKGYKLVNCDTVMYYLGDGASSGVWCYLLGK